MSARALTSRRSEATKSEKLLALVLAVFLLMGGIWAYVKIDDYVRDGASTRPRASARIRRAIGRGITRRSTRSARAE